MNISYNYFRNSKGAKPFRISKNKKPISFFGKLEQNNSVEPIIPKNGFIPPGLSNQIEPAPNQNENVPEILDIQNQIVNEMEENEGF